ncbi:hypothetical protein AB0C14_29415 [Microbispora hainanensis]|uniref:hypothetical protein n=1 Tax=Microbispora hainanensis TaxID=568844 RepID=UPI0033F78CD4
MADQDAGSRGAGDEPRGPRPEPETGQARPSEPTATSGSAEPSGPTAPLPPGNTPTTPWTSPAGSPGGVGSPRTGSGNTPGGAGPGSPGHAGPGSAWSGPGNVGPGSPWTGPGNRPGAPGPYATWAGPAGPGPSGPGAAGAPPTGSGYAFGPGGAGWNAPGWHDPRPRIASAPRPGIGTRLAARLPRGHAGQLVAVGVASAIVGALLGGGVVALTGMVWDRSHAGTTWIGGDDRQRFFPPGFGQDVPQGQNGLPPWCRQTDAGVRCQVPR